jgi:hypothetical protein
MTWLNYVSEKTDDCEWKQWMKAGNTTQSSRRSPDVRALQLHHCCLHGCRRKVENPSKNWWNTGTRVVGYGRFALSQVAPGQAGPCICMLMRRSLWALCQWPFATIWWRGNGTYTMPAAGLVQVLDYTEREERTYYACFAVPVHF